MDGSASLSGFAKQPPALRGAAAHRIDLLLQGLDALALGIQLLLPLAALAAPLLQRRSLVFLCTCNSRESSSVLILMRGTCCLTLPIPRRTQQYGSLGWLAPERLLACAPWMLDQAWMQLHRGEVQPHALAAGTQPTLTILLGGRGGAAGSGLIIGVVIHLLLLLVAPLAAASACMAEDTGAIHSLHAASKHSCTIRLGTWCIKVGGPSRSGACNLHCTRAGMQAVHDA